MHGVGHYIWGDGREYKGDYANDKKHGFGKYLWPDGRIYVGQWEKGKQNGYGKYVQKSGNIQFGIWKAGKRVQVLSSEEVENLKDTEIFQRLSKEIINNK